MAKKNKNITQTTIIPNGSVERVMAPRYEGEDLLKTSGIFVVGISDLKKGYTIGRPDSLFHVLIFCTSGGGKLRAGNKEVMFREGEVILIPRGEQYYSSNQDFSILWVHLDPMHKRFSHLLNSPARVWPCLKSDLVPIFELFYQETRHIAQQNLQVLKSLVQLLSSAIDREVKEEGSPRIQKKRIELEKLWSEVSQKLSHPWSVGEMSSKLHMSLNQFHSLCAEIYDQTPMGMVSELRMEEARMLLLHSDEKLRGIAETVGFSSPYSLSRSIKRHFGLSPREIRAKW